MNGFKEQIVEYKFGDGSGRALALREITFPPTDREETYIIVRWSDLEAVASHTVQQLQMQAEAGKIPPLDEMVGIANGGLPFAVLLARGLNLTRKVKTIGVNGYDDNNKPLPHKILEYGLPNGTNFAGRTVGLVDEICDEGETFKVGEPEIKNVNPDRIVTIAAFKRAGAKYDPDLFGVEITTPWWLQFEHDWAESRRSFWKRWAPHNVRFDEVLERFQHAFGTTLSKEQTIAEEMGVEKSGDGYVANKAGLYIRP